MRRGVSRIPNGFDWREGRVVKERVTALKTLRLARAEIVGGSAWTSRFVRDHETVGAERFGIGDRKDVLSRYDRRSALLRTPKPAIGRVVVNPGT